jgi:hypothetical protein
MGYRVRNYTLCSIPASARAVYAPREKPIDENPLSKPLTSRTAMWTRRTKDADFVTNVVILHEEFVSPHYMVVEIPGDSFIQKLGTLSKEW